jgi:hypothetical protein
MLRNGVIPIPPARNMAGFPIFLCRTKVPAAGRIFTFAATGNLFSERLKAVLRIRVVKTNSSAEGGARDGECASVSFGVGFQWFRECHIDGPARSEIESGRLLERKAKVSYATSSRRISVEVFSAIGPL